MSHLKFSRSLLVAHLGIGLGLSPLPFYTLTVLAPALAIRLSMPVPQLMAGLSIMTVVVVALGPWVGRLTDRLGVHRVVLTSQSLYGVAIMAFAFNTGAIWQYWLHWLLLSLFGLGTMPVVWLKALNPWATRHKARWFAVALSGTGVCALTLPKLCTWILSTPRYEWQGLHLESWQLAYVVLGALVLFMVPLTAALMPRMPLESNDPVPILAGLTLQEALRQPEYWLIAAAFMPIAFAVGGPVPNLVFIFKEHHFDVNQVKLVLPSLGLWVIFGRCIGGICMDRWHAATVAAVMLCLPLLGLSWLMVGAPTDSVWPIELLVAGLGLAIGLEYDLLAYLVARYFGHQHFGAIYASLYSSFALGAGFAAAIYAYSNERWLSYDPILILGGVGMAMAGLLLLRLGKYRYGG